MSLLFLRSSVDRLKDKNLKPVKNTLSKLNFRKDTSSQKTK